MVILLQHHAMLPGRSARKILCKSPTSPQEQTHYAHTAQSASHPLRSALCLALLLCIALASCRKNPGMIPEEPIPLPPQTLSQIQGFYLLNEGNMNMNKASLDYYDYASGNYRRNLYEQANPDATRGLGDVGNDIGIYGSKLYAVINCSNKVEVMDVASAKRLAVIQAKNCRYICFAQGKAYLSAYDGEVNLGPNSPNGFVAEIDTTTLQILRTIEVGRQPEEMAVANGKLYVANSGGYSPPNYERSLTVIDLNTFTKIKDIDVDINLHRVKADPKGNLYVSARGDYFDQPPCLYLIDTKKDVILKKFDRPAANLSIAGDTVYVVGAAFSYDSFDWEVHYYSIHTPSATILPGSFVPQSLAQNIQTPYGLAVDPQSKNIYLTDATDYVSPGKLHCISPTGQILFSVTTGDIPAHFAFRTQEIQINPTP